MPAKALELSVELFVDAVSCPGVWLCADGQVSLSVFTLGSSHQTARLPPAFPIQFKDVFYFRRKINKACSLSNLSHALNGEKMYCELIQWKCNCAPVVLAQYLGELSDVLFPPDFCANDGVDLLMRGTSEFPGIISPKIEISTKIRVDEVYHDETGSPGNPESGQVKPVGVTIFQEQDQRRQKTVCHSRMYHKSRCQSTGKSPKRHGKAVQTYGNVASTTQRVASVIESCVIERCASRARPSRSKTKRSEEPEFKYPCSCEICQQYHRMFDNR